MIFRYTYCLIFNVIYINFLLDLMGNCCANDQGNVSQPAAQSKPSGNSGDKIEKAANAVF